MAYLVPTVGLAGVYTLKTPFVADTTQQWTCVSIRTIVELKASGVDVLATYYTPNGLDEDKYNEDVTNGVSIITILSQSDSVVRFPNSYLLSFPDSSSVPYSHIILSCSLGAIPDALDLTFLKQQVASIVSDTIGVEPTVKEHVAAMSGTVTIAQDKQLTAIREAAIKNRTTDRAKYLAQLAINTSLQEQIQALEAALVGSSTTS